MELRAIICRAALGSNEDILYLIDKFSPILKKYASLLGYEDAYNDLRLFFMELIRRIANNSNLESDAQIVAYIKTSIIHHYYAKSKEKRTYKGHHFALDWENDAAVRAVEASGATYDDYSAIEWEDLLSALTELERLTIIGIFRDCKSAAEIARKLGCSRQCVNQAKKRGLKN